MRCCLPRGAAATAACHVMPLPVCAVVGLGGGGIGDHVAKKFAAEGYAVAMLSRTKSNLDALERRIANSKGFVCDACNVEQVKKVVPEIVAALGPIDVLIYNAGSAIWKGFLDTTEEEFEHVWRGGPMGLFVFAQAVAPSMIERGSGAIGVTGATASWRGMPVTAAFASAKFGLRALSESLARDLGPKGVHVFHVIIDGAVDQPKARESIKDTPDSVFLDPAAIAETYFAMARQPRRCWGFEINLAASSQFGSLLTI
mmetsp:Transcript_35357/g.75317  ORF Transcript_35357/g.75317 Transcript_35357/m.75317 type:complete len:257 (+) Transcript_35357:12-782(+)